MIKLGLIGKTNVGKTTFFNSATLLNAKISARAFATSKSNTGMAFVRTPCVCTEIGIKDNPQNSACKEGWRFAQLEIIDLPGLMEGAWTGKGLGNQFLNVAMQADALLHVIDASGSIDKAGEIRKPGIGDPVRDVLDTEEELVMWFVKIIQKNRKRITRQADIRHVRLDRALHRILSGIKVSREQIIKSIECVDSSKSFEKWTDEDIKSFAQCLRKFSKPTLIVANKMDLPSASDNFEKLREEFPDMLIVPCSAESELALRRAESRSLVSYVPGEEVFRVVNHDKLTDRQSAALDYVENRVFLKWMRTGVQFALDTAVFKLLHVNAVYPIDDLNNFSDKKGNVLPDVFLVKEGTTVLELAEQVHTDLAKTMIYAVDARTGLRLPKEYLVRDRDIIKVVAVAERR